MINHIFSFFTKKQNLLLLSLTFIFLFANPFEGISQRKKKSKSKPAIKESFDEFYYNTMKWRLIGPFRGGRAGTVTGVTPYMSSQSREDSSDGESSGGIPTSDSGYMSQ